MVHDNTKVQLDRHLFEYKIGTIATDGCFITSHNSTFSITFNASVIACKTAN